MDTSRRTADQSLVAKVVSSYVKKNELSPSDMPALINTVYQSLLALGKPPEPEPRNPAASAVLLRATMLFASNAAGKGIRCVCISRRSTA
jgi:predicted transcriptional regulator